jgi:hypothetical protein
MLACVTRPQNFIARPHHGSLHTHKISNRYNSPNPFKNAVTELARALVKRNSIASIFLNDRIVHKKTTAFLCYQLFQSAIVKKLGILVKFDVSQIYLIQFLKIISLQNSKNTRWLCVKITFLFEKIYHMKKLYKKYRKKFIFLFINITRLFNKEEKEEKNISNIYSARHSSVMTIYTKSHSDSVTVYLLETNKKSTKEKQK